MMAKRARTATAACPLSTPPLYYLSYTPRLRPVPPLSKTPGPHAPAAATHDAHQPAPHLHLSQQELRLWRQRGRVAAPLGRHPPQLVARARKQAPEVELGGGRAGGQGNGCGEATGREAARALA